mmetsp:Transcript_21831/g.50287  ORF Transcript_21831/g.50287 Transcript_21831/m.50287 type:complete len:213 (-) Transcript_21831:142-780(-)
MHSGRHLDCECVHVSVLALSPRATERLVEYVDGKDVPRVGVAVGHGLPAADGVLGAELGRVEHGGRVGARRVQAVHVEHDQDAAVRALRHEPIQDLEARVARQWRREALVGFGSDVARSAVVEHEVQVHRHTESVKLVLFQKVEEERKGLRPNAVEEARRGLETMPVEALKLKRRAIHLDLAALTREGDCGVRRVRSGAKGQGGDRPRDDAL